MGGGGGVFQAGGLEIRVPPLYEENVITLFLYTPQYPVWEIFMKFVFWIKIIRMFVVFLIRGWRRFGGEGGWFQPGG